MSAGSRKTAKIKAEWQVRITDGSNESSSSSDNVSEQEERICETAKIPEEQGNIECCDKKSEKREGKRKQKWIPKPANDVSAKVNLVVQKGLTVKKGKSISILRYVNASIS